MPGAQPSDGQDSAATGDGATSSRLAAWLARTVVWIALGLITLYAVWQAASVMPVRLANPYANSMVEAQPVAGAMRVARGEPLYRDFRTDDSVVPLTYGALLYAVPGWAGRASGTTSAQELAQLGRVQALLAGVGIILFAALLARRQGARGAWGWLAAAPLLWFPYPLEWATKFAPDLPALMLGLAGWWIAGGPQDRSAGWRSAAALERGAGAVLCWTLAFHFKPTIVVGPVGFVAEALVFAGRATARRVEDGPASVARWASTLLRSRAVVAAALIALAFVACCLASGLALDRATGGLWRLNLVEAMRVCAYDLRFVIADLRFLRFDGVAALFWMAAVAVILFRGTPAGLAFLIILPLDLVLMSKQGSSANYLLESIVVWGIAAAAAFGSGRRFDSATRDGLDRTTASWLLFPVFAILLIGAGKLGTVFWEIDPPATRELREVDAIVAQVPPSTVLGMDPFYGLSRGLALPFADPYHASLLATHGVADLGAVAQRIEQAGYAAIVGNRLMLGNAAYHGQPLYPDVLRRALRERYRPAYEGDWLVVWVPRTP
jgi:hypothetical protein